MTAPAAYALSRLETDRERTGRRYLEFLRVPSMSGGLYVLRAGDTDPQSPHGEDEVYVVVRGRGRMRIGRDDEAVSAGSVVFIPAHVEHRFHDIEEDLVVFVFFAPAEGAAAGVPDRRA
jgi:mannose-6-phosphate isomerase-like protein (cupin superfamily)